MDITRTIADSIYELQERLREKEHEEKKEDFQGKRINTIIIDRKMYLIDKKTYNVYDINTFEFIGTYNSILDNSLEGFRENDIKSEILQVNCNSVASREVEASGRNYNSVASREVEESIPRTSFVSVAEYLRRLSIG